MKNNSTLLGKTTPSKNDIIQDLKDVQDKYPDKIITRNFYRYHGNFSETEYSKIFGTFRELQRAAGLFNTRFQNKLIADTAKHASADVYRDFYIKEILPWHEKYDWSSKQKKKYKNILVGSDFHDIESDKFVLSLFIEQAKNMDHIVLNGDVFDNPHFGKYNIDPRTWGIKERFDFVKYHIFKPLREAAPDAIIDFIIGNHEARLLKLLAEQSPNIKILLSDVMGLTLSDLFGLKEFKINLVSKIDLSFFNASEMKNEIKENYKIYYDTFVACHEKNYKFGLSGVSGHTHRPSLETMSNVPMGKIWWCNIGCIKNTITEYVPGMDKWTNSFLRVWINTENKKAIPEHILIPSDFAIIDGILYESKKSI